MFGERICFLIKWEFSDAGSQDAIYGNAMYIFACCIYPWSDDKCRIYKFCDRDSIMIIYGEHVELEEFKEA